MRFTFILVINAILIRVNFDYKKKFMNILKKILGFERKIILRVIRPLEK